MKPSFSTDKSIKPRPPLPKEGGRLAPAWIFGLVNPVIKALLRSKLHFLISGMLMLITYKGRKSGKVYTHPIGYFLWDRDEWISFTSARWWINLLDGNPVNLLVKGQTREAIPTVIHEQPALAETGQEFVRRLGMKSVIRLMLGLPHDREPTPDDFRAFPPGRIIVIFKIVSPS